MYRNRRKSVWHRLQSICINRIIQYSVQFHLFQKICLQCQTRYVCVRACVWCMCLWYWLYIFGLMWVIIWRTFNPTTKTGKNSADTAIHSHTHSTHRERHTHTLTIFKWEMTNATETAQTAIKFIIYLNCQAFFIRVFFVHKVTSTRGPNRIFVNYFVWFRSKTKRVGAHQSTIRSQQNSVCK